MNNDYKYVISRNIDGENVNITLTDEEMSKIASAYNAEKLKPYICRAIVNSYGAAGEAFVKGEISDINFSTKDVIDEIAEGVYAMTEMNEQQIEQVVVDTLNEYRIDDTLTAYNHSLKAKQNQNIEKD